ncbi:ferritin-like domain-containing protein [Myxococcota bacterium]|nr:ferritin-like domain-containing protein [Myxococcota bacterium]
MTDPSLARLRALLLSSLVLPAAALTPACDDKDEEDDTGTGLTDGGADDTGTSDPGCVGEEMILDEAGAPTGYVVCADGAINRVEARAWDPTILAPRCEGTEIDRACEVDADCTAKPHGACIAYNYKGGAADACGCVYSCEKDADCGAGELCIGQGVKPGIVEWSECVPASCEVSADCPSGECGLSAWDDGCGYLVELSCRSDADECRDDGDCPEIACGLGYGEDFFSCQEMSCTPGRPLKVDGLARTAPVGAVQGWAAALAPAVPASRKARRALAAAWGEVGALEHASVGSFARFSLELMGLGAPPELLREAQQAAADEVEHAKLAFGLASAYAGQPVGPGPMSLAGVAPEGRAEAVLAALIEDACVNEALAAAEAEAAAEGCADPVVAGVLRRIAADEARHAALGWRCLAWLLEARPELVPAAEAAFAAQGRRLAARTPGSGHDLAALGLLSPAARARTHEAAWQEVVAPCQAALLSPAGRQAA